MPRPSPQTERVIAVINVVTPAADGLTMTEIARSIGESQATCVHLLAALTASGFLIREPATRRYFIGPSLVEPGRVAKARYGDLAVVRSEMVALSNELGMDCVHFVLDGDHARLAQCTSPHGGPRLPLRVGEMFPLVPPLGILFAAWLDDAAFESWLERSPQPSAGRDERFREQRRVVVRDGFVTEVQPDSVAGEDFVRVIDDRPSPYRDGHLHRLLGDDGRADYNLTEVDPDQDYRLGDIGAPIFGEPGRVTMTLNVIITDRTPVRGTQVEPIGRAVRAAADRITVALA